MRQTIIISLVLFLSACASAPKMPENPRPDWVSNPGSNFVGKCGTHIRGLIAQEECAYKNGLSYIAMSKGVSIDIEASFSMKQSSTSTSGRSHGEVESTMAMDQKDIHISAEIIDKWHDRVRDVLFVLIQEN
ncbi:MAG: hypothetical protein H8E21_04245 [Gammaproteobacteria bacterium]|nr:hypothetical protein [Gammaproteobacteria bacterium]MBL6999267.1 hypothetical protein [Gammaproteobacteria bacterium]